MKMYEIEDKDEIMDMLKKVKKYICYIEEAINAEERKYSRYV